MKAVVKWPARRVDQSREDIVSTTIAESLFLLALWAPPLAVIAGALLLVVRVPTVRAADLPERTAAAHR